MARRRCVKRRKTKRHGCLKWTTARKRGGKRRRGGRGNRRIGVCSRKCKGRGKRARKACMKRCM